MYMCGASNKAYDYLSAGCAVLVSDLPEWRETYVFSEYGFACDPGSSESIAAALTKFYNNFEETLDMGRRGREKVLSEWNYEKAFESVLKKIDYLQ